MPVEWHREANREAVQPQQFERIVSRPLSDRVPDASPGIPQLYRLTLIGCTKLTNVDSVGYGTQLIELSLTDLRISGRCMCCVLLPKAGASQFDGLSKVDRFQASLVRYRSFGMCRFQFPVRLVRSGQVGDR